MISRSPMTHDLKTHPDPFTKVWRGDKRAELRIDDRDFRIGDLLTLREWKPKKCTYTGRTYASKITDITRLSHWVPDVDGRWVILHMGEQGRREKKGL